MQGRPGQHVSNGNDNFSQLDLQRNHHFPRVFNFSQKLSPFVRPKGDKTVAEVPKGDPDPPAKDRREAGVQQLAGDPQSVAVRTQLDEEIQFQWFSAIE